MTRRPSVRIAANGRAVRVDQPENLVDRAYTYIESQIVTLRLAPGAVVSEIELANNLGMSRTPVGEALQRLAREGLVTVLPRRGIVVTELSVSDQIKLLELRGEVSRFLARTGAQRAKLQQRTQLRAVARAFTDAAASSDEAAFLQADKAFHTLFSQCAQNDYAFTVMESMDSQSRRFWFAHRPDSADLAVSAGLHSDIALAMADADAKAAEQASDALTAYLDAFARGTLMPAR